MLKNRLLSYGVLLFTLGVTISVFFSGLVLPFCVFAIFVLCIFLCIAHFFKIKIKIKTIVVYSLLPLCGVLFCLIYKNIFIVPYSSYNEISATVSGTVYEINSYMGAEGYNIVLDSSNTSIPLGTKIRIYSDQPSTIKIGDIVTSKVKLSAAINKSQLLANGIKLFGYSDVKKSGVDSSILYKIKLASQEKIDSAFGPKSAAFIKAITLGDKSDMSPLDYSAYAKAGVSHMLVISGLHLSLIVFTLFSLLKGFGTNKYVTLFLCLCTDLFICFMTGFTPSVVRSSVMLLFLLVGKTFLLSYDSTTSLFTALLILIIFNPYCIASLGMELSFLSTFGILAVSSKIGSFDIHKHPILSKLTNTFLVPFIFSFVTFVFTLPVTFLRLDIISIISPIANMLLSVIFAPLLILSFVFVVISFVFLPAASLLAPIIDFFILMFSNTVDFLLGFDFSFVSASLPFFKIAAVAAILCVFLCLILKLKYRLISISICVAFTSLIIVLGLQKSYKMIENNTFLCYNSSYSSAAAIISNEHRQLLIDICGDSQHSSFAYRNGFCYINEFMIISYNDFSVEKSHYMLNAFELDTIFLPNPLTEYENIIFDGIKLLADGKNCNIKTFEDNYSFNVGDLSVLIDFETLNGSVTKLDFAAQQKSHSILFDLYDNSASKYGNLGFDYVFSGKSYGKDIIARFGNQNDFEVTENEH